MSAYPRCMGCKQDLVPDDGELCGICAQAEIAAAEARGRKQGDAEGFRRGVEEAAKAGRALLAQEERHAAAAEGRAERTKYLGDALAGQDCRSAARGIKEFIDRIAHLAPREAKEDPT